MIKFSLKSNSILYCLLLFCVSVNCFAQDVQDMQEKVSLLPIDTCEEILSNYYRTNTIEIDRLFENLTVAGNKLSSLLNTESKVNRNIEEENKLLVHYLEYAKVISTAYVFGSAQKYSRRVNKIDAEINSFIKKAKPNADVYLKLADYMYTKISLPHNFNIISTLPVLYRKTLLKAHDKNEAMAKLAWWCVSAANETTSNFAGFIERAETHIEELNVSDRFMSYIWYSIYYMKTYNVEKGLEYFNKAKAIFPNHLWLIALYDNYQKGKLGL